MVSYGAWISTINSAVVGLICTRRGYICINVLLHTCNKGPFFSAGIINSEAKIALELDRQSCVTVALNLWRRLSREVCWL